MFVHSIFIAGLILVSANIARADSVQPSSGACLSRADVAWSPSVARDFGLIDAKGVGCVTPSQIASYAAAMKADRKGHADRIKAAMQATN